MLEAPIFDVGGRLADPIVTVSRLQALRAAQLARAS